MNKHNLSYLFTLLIALALSAATSAQPVTVGPGPDCDFDNLQSAIVAAPESGEIRVSQDYPGTNTPYTIVDQNLTIHGGWSDCGSGSAPIGWNVLDAGGNGAVMRIVESPFLNELTRQVNLFDLDLVGGSGTDPLNSGGLLVQGRPGMLQVRLDNVWILGNARSGFGNSGGGVRLIAQSGAATGLPPSALLSPMLSIQENSRIGDNLAEDSGGGLYCFSNQDTGSIDMIDFSRGVIAENEAARGGGVAIDGCRGVRLNTGGLIVLGQPRVGIFGNQATDSGGALLLRGAAEVTIGGALLGSFNSGGLVMGNSAVLGSAAAVYDQAVLRLEDTWVRGNEASSSGTFFLVGEASVEVEGSGASGFCKPLDLNQDLVQIRPCSVIEHNRANTVAVASQSGASSMSLRRAVVRHNSATGIFQLSELFSIWHSSLYEGPSARLDMISTLIYDNPVRYVMRINGSGLIEAIHGSIIHPGSELAALSTQIAQHQARLTVRASIMINNNTTALVQALADAQVSAEAECLLSNRPEQGSGLTSAALYLQADPRFVDPPGADFRLADDSPAIDFCYAVAALDDLSPDLGGQDRGQVWTGPPPVVSNPGSGAFDLGAFEAYAPDRLFRDRFGGVGL